MVDEEDYIMWPVTEGMCKYESLKDGTLDLVDIARMTEALLVNGENRRIMRELAREE